MLRTVFRFYSLYGSFKTETSYRQNCRVGIVANSIEQAIATAKQLHPDMTVWDVNHHGEVHAICETATSLFVGHDAK